MHWWPLAQVAGVASALYTTPRHMRMYHTRRPRLNAYNRARFELLYKSPPRPQQQHQHQQHDDREGEGGVGLHRRGQLVWQYEPRAVVDLLQLSRLQEGRLFDYSGAAVLVGLQQRCAGATAALPPPPPFNRIECECAASSADLQNWTALATLVVVAVCADPRAHHRREPG